MKKAGKGSRKDHWRKMLFRLTIICPSFLFFFLISEAGYRAEQRPGGWSPVTSQHHSRAASI